MLSTLEYFPSMLEGGGVTVVKMSLFSPLARAAFDWQVPRTVGRGSNLDSGCRQRECKEKPESK